MQLRQLNHRLDVVEDILVGNFAVVESDIVDTRHNNHGARVQLDNIATETHQHVRSGLTADTTTYKVVLSEKVWVVLCPILGD